MSKKILFVFMALLMLPISVSAGGKSPWDVKLPFKSATIHYTITGMENGNEVVYIRDHGRETATYHTTKMSMMGMSMVNETVTIENPDWVYDFNLTEKTGTKSVNPAKYMNEEYNKLSKADKKLVEKNGEEMGVSMSEGFGGKVEQNAKKILGYNCDRAEMMGTVVYSIHGSGIPLFLESNMMGVAMKVEATSVEKGKVNSKFFKFPAGIEPRFDAQSDAVAREMAKQTIAGLKDPESMKKMGGMPMMQGKKQEMTPEEEEQMKQAMEMLKGMFGNQPQQ
jgi:hypothetical protein